MSFDSFGLDPKLLRALGDMGFEAPTPIQKMAIPPLLEGRDVLAAAATGSGKTAAFLLPLLHRLSGKPRGATKVLVLAPTRELAAQIADHMKELARHTPLRCAAIFGGVGMEPQVRAMKGGVDVLVATPGRLLDHLQYPYARLDSVEYLVLDEADRMLDMGFLPDVRRILQRVPAKRQTLLFSATLPPPIVQLAGEMLRDPARLNVERKSAPAVGITHEAYPVAHELKSYLLLELLKRPDFRSVLAFTRTKHRANRLADFLEKRGVSCARIHGNRSQLQRTEALAGFKGGAVRVLVATDIAARGIDVEALGLVVNFDVPNLPEDYIHRVGRTARAELTGHAYTFVSPEEERDFRDIEAHVGRRIPRLTVAGFDYAHKPQEKLEIPIAERIASIRARRADERARAKAKADAKAVREAAGAGRGSRAAGDAPGKPAKGSRPGPAQRAERTQRRADSGDSGRRSSPSHARDRFRDGGRESRRESGKRGENPRKQGRGEGAPATAGQGNVENRERPSFIRSKVRPQWDSQASGPAGGGSGGEGVSRKDSVPGRSSWGAAWRRQQEQAPSETGPAE